MKKNKISKNWIIKQHRDPFFKQSKIQGYKSRSAFKLVEMNEKFKFLNQNSYLLDLGSSPGGWSQVAAKKITKGKILAIDIKLMNKIEKVHFRKITNCVYNDPESDSHIEKETVKKVTPTNNIIKIKEGDKKSPCKFKPNKNWAIIQLENETNP